MKYKICCIVELVIIIVLSYFVFDLNKNIDILNDQITDDLIQVLNEAPGDYWVIDSVDIIKSDQLSGISITRKGDIAYNNEYLKLNKEQRYHIVVLFIKIEKYLLSNNKQQDI